MNVTVRKADNFKRLVDEVAANLAVALHQPEGSYVRTPILYPSGATVVVRVEMVGNSFRVSDMGGGYAEAESMGAAAGFARQAKIVAEASGLVFDQHAFVVSDASRDQLIGAVIAVANCSQEAAHVTATRHVEKKAHDANERVYKRLVSVFTPEHVQRDVEVAGASNTKWHVGALVTVDHKKAVFEAVTRHRNSVVSAAVKFHDFARLEKPPARIAVVDKKADFGTLLGVISQAAQVVEESASAQTLQRLAKAA